MTGKFIVYASCNANGLIEIPQDKKIIKDAVKQYENYIDFILIEIQKNFKTAFPDSENNLDVVNEIFKKLNLIRV